MNILEKFTALSKGKSAKIGIGLGDHKLHNIKILKASSALLANHDISIYFFGKKESLAQISEDDDYQNKKSNLSLVESEAPENEIIEWLKSGKIDAVIRGSLSSSSFLKASKKMLNIEEITRLTLLETFNGYQFFYGPVGIDECNNFRKKQIFIEKTLQIFNLLDIKPKISVLSGGRKDDLGRDSIVDETINTANDLVLFFKKKLPDLDMSHDEILIENAIDKKANLIIAPDGISGNLIYRTVVHLGGGKAHGAIYMGLDNIIIDTSRVGKISEIKGAILLALSLIK